MNYLKLWPFLALALIPIAYFIGLWVGASNKETEMNNAQLIASAKTAIQTVSAVKKVEKEYQPVYIEIEKHHEAPSCPAPPVLVDIINRLPDSKSVN